MINIILELTLVIFLSRRNALLAMRKGLQPFLWGFVTFAAWLFAPREGVHKTVMPVLETALINGFKVTRRPSVAQD